MEQRINLRGDQYSLKWNQFSSNLLEVIREKQIYEALTDVTLFCEGQYIKAHKIVLSASSLVFEEMFSNHTVNHPYIVMNGVSFKDLKYMIDFIYNGEIKVYDSDLQGVLNMGENFKIKGLSSVKVRENKTPVPLDLTPESNIKSTNNIEEVETLPEMYFDEGKYLLARANSSKKAEEVQKPITSQHVNNEKSPPAKKRIIEYLDKSKFKTVRTLHSNVNISSPKPGTETDQNGQANKVATSKDVKVKKLPGDSNTYRVDIAEKIPRPQNAFMLFANEMRKKVAAEFPQESNKSVSIRLGNMWKTLPSKEKQVYFDQAKQADDLHKIKYPNYCYSPYQARIRKAATSLGKGIVTDNTLELVNFVVKKTMNDNQDRMDTIDITEEPMEIPVTQQEKT